MRRHNRTVLGVCHDYGAVMHRDPEERVDSAAKRAWQMPALDELPKAVLTPLNRLWLIVLRLYLIGAVALVVIRVTQIALRHGSL